MRYSVFVHKDPDSSFGVMFPELPGCFSAGETLDEALVNAGEALAMHIEGMEEDGEEVPLPLPIEIIVSDPRFAEAREGGVIASVPLVRDLGSTTRINVSLDLGLLRAIDGEAKRRKQTRSAFIASAMRREIQDA
jgi:predicted RNase H-like HicB family nuclease